MIPLRCDLPDYLSLLIKVFKLLKSLLLNTIAVFGVDSLIASDLISSLLQDLISHQERLSTPELVAILCYKWSSEFSSQCVFDLPNI